MARWSKARRRMRIFWFSMVEGGVTDYVVVLQGE
jgi:hypothetical protein